jgi:DNA replication protein DnaC
MNKIFSTTCLRKEVDGSNCLVGRLLNINDLWKLRRIMTASMRCIEERWTPLCFECHDLGWLFIDGHGVKECQCRVQTRIARRLERIAPEYECLHLEEITPDLNRHPQQALAWKTVRENPDGCYLICGRSGAGKTTILQALYARAVLLDRPAVAVSLANLIGDYRRAELAKYEDEYVPLITPTSLATRRDRWFVGLDDFHIGRPTRFAGEMIYRLLDNIYSYRHQLVVTSQVDKEKLEQHWGEAGAGYGAAIMRRVVEIDGAVCLSMF